MDVLVITEKIQNPINDIFQRINTVQLEFEYLRIIKY